MDDHRIFAYRIVNFGSCGSWYDIVHLFFCSIRVPLHQKEAQSFVSGKHDYCRSKVYAPYPLQRKVTDSFDPFGCRNTFSVRCHHTFCLVSIQSCGANYSVRD